MQYQSYQPSTELAPFVKCYWTLEVPVEERHERQRIIPDGCIELAFILGEDIKRYTSKNDFIIQPRALVLGPTLEPFYIQPIGYVHTFAASFYPYAFAPLIDKPIVQLKNKETSIYELFDDQQAQELDIAIINASHTQERIQRLESFLLAKLSHQATIECIVKDTVAIMLSKDGQVCIDELTGSSASQKRRLERRFLEGVGVSPKKLSKLIRFQSVLKSMVQQQESLTQIAMQADYYDQSHFIKDFKALTGVRPRDFFDEDSMALTWLFNQ